MQEETRRVALVTGGNSGIGLGFASGLAQAGAAVCIWGTNEEKNRAAEESLRAHGGRVLALRCDVGDPHQIAEAFARTVEELGRVDACYANAGVGGRGTPFVDLGLEEWRRIFQINMEGVFQTFQQAIRHMIERGGGGSLVVTSSSSAIFGAPRSEHYAATKAGVIALAKGLAKENAPDIRVNTIAPAAVDTGSASDRVPLMASIVCWACSIARSRCAGGRRSTPRRRSGSWSRATR